MNAQNQPITNDIAAKMLADKEFEVLAGEAAALIKEQANIIHRMENFAKRAGARPQDVVMSFGMQKLEAKIILS